MDLENEDQIKRALGIESWRNLSKEKVVKFAAMVPELDKEVLLKIVDQLPEFRKFGEEALDQLDKTQQSLFASNDKSMKRLQRSFLDTRNLLSTMINGAELDPGDRRYFVDKYFELLAMESDAHVNNQRFLRDQAILKTLLAAGTVAVSVLAIGGRIMMQRLK